MHTKSRPSGGFTLIELLIVVAIVGVLAALAAPAFTKLLDRGRLRGAAEQVFSDLQLARTEAIKRNADVKVTFSTDTPSTTWCYGIRVGGDCDCTETDVTASDACVINDGVLKVVSSLDFRDVTLEADFFGTGINHRTTGFNSRTGTAETGPSSSAAEDGTVSLAIGSDTVQVTVAKLGRVIACTTTGMPGFRPC